VVSGIATAVPDGVGTIVMKLVNWIGCWILKAVYNELSCGMDVICAIELAGVKTGVTGGTIAPKSHPWLTNATLKRFWFYLRGLL